MCQQGCSNKQDAQVPNSTLRCFVLNVCIVLCLTHGVLPVICNNDLISGIDRVTKSLAECIQLGKTVLGRPGGSAILPHGLRNNTAVYSDQI